MAQSEFTNTTTGGIIFLNKNINISENTFHIIQKCVFNNSQGLNEALLKL